MRHSPVRRLSFLLAGAALLPMLPAQAQNQVQNQVQPGAVSRPAPLADLVSKVDIPYEQFTLKNGLRVIVHTDRKAPVVGVVVYYRVGSKNEPKGKTGFAHLFEHLMFGGSENLPNPDEVLTEAGSTGLNGSTWFDRTNYVETVPVGALDLALFSEADRMGRLLGAVTQAKLDAQRAVVQNEKRQGDNQPFGLVEYAQLAALYPDGHPYRHSTIGSMADLDAASLADVKKWFTDNYGPNNAVLVLAGDIDAKTARPKIEKYFGGIQPGPKVAPVAAPVPVLAKPVTQEMKDRVATTRLYRVWNTPGLNDPDSRMLSVGAAVLGGLSSSRLDNELVRKEQIAVAVTAGVQQFEQVGQFEVTADVKPGVDPALVAKRLDEIIADYIAKGPTADEVQRVATRQVASEISGLEVVGGFSGKAATLAEGLLYSGDPERYKKDLAAIASATPAAVTTAMGKWLTRPNYALRVDPGERDAYEEALVGAPGKDVAAAEVVPPKPKLATPAVTASPGVDFPAVESGALSNGIKVHVARRTTVPTVQMSLSFDQGIAADPKDRAGIGTLMLSLLEAGTTTRDTIQIAEEQERLGANISTSQGMDRTLVSLFALKPNLSPSLDLLADVVRNPAFTTSEIERLRAIQLASIAQEKTQPQGIATRAIFPIIYGPQHPYGVAARGLGDTDTVKAVTQGELRSFHQRWIVPNKAEIFVAGDTTLAEILPLLEARFAQWPTVRIASPTKDFSVPVPPARPGIFLVDRPQSPQSMILGGYVTGSKGSDDLVAFNAANTVLGDDFLSRLNSDIRETKGWSYGVRSYLSTRIERSPYIVAAPVQADKTGPAIAAMTADMQNFLGTKGVTPAEFSRVVKGEIAGLPARFETTGAVLAQMREDANYGRPFDYVESLAGRYAKLTPETMNAAARSIVDPAKISWIVVGDKAAIKSQLDALGMPVSEIDSNGQPAK
ncbi:M16 family metallopeptidase [Sphingobium sp. CR28]|uniref:M16 family metallopeptidase n=1 Tax=Sphingobium sp. CR28 TaxID=3400272 RepID=UPI003FF0420D